ncbi:hypothetical protein NITHO_1310002 [Nitrolancea hollandica Lb]|uniref:Uncharacterized protein n=1 Tax=Nitrolancea hollandica Lb TaxID=1129897 RepID=I4ED12_9BACT|nr:hypothetical protein NITHO_1310002 [Nitrolancea hollandica Lb]
MDRARLGVPGAVHYFVKNTRHARPSRLASPLTGSLTHRLPTGHHPATDRGPPAIPHAENRVEFGYVSTTLWEHCSQRDLTREVRLDNSPCILQNAGRSGYASTTHPFSSEIRDFVCKIRVLPRPDTDVDGIDWEATVEIGSGGGQREPRVGAGKRAGHRGTTPSTGGGHRETLGRIGSRGPDVYQQVRAAG